MGDGEVQVILRKSLLLLSDVFFIILSFFVAFLVRFEFDIPVFYFNTIGPTLLLATFSYILIFYFFGLYHSLWRYMSVDELFKLVFASLLGGISSYFINIVLKNPIPRSVLLITWILVVFEAGSLRLGYRVLRRVFRKSQNRPLDYKRILIVGAGDAAAMLIKELNQQITSYLPILAVDDAKWKEKSKILGVPIVYDISKIKRYTEEYAIDEIFIAIPTLSKQRFKEVIQLAQATKCKVKTLPSLNDIVHDEISIENIREVNIEDLLGRDEVHLDIDGISEYLENEVVMVTGGGGSIGSELCRQICKFKPQHLLILDNYENNAFELEQELHYKYPEQKVSVIIANVREKDRLDRIFSQYTPNIVFHAAAHKHVPLMEANPEEAVKNNVLGTYNVAQCAHVYKTKRFVLISTDKAVNPTNIMGATKRLAEMIIQAMDQQSETEFAAVRFGNVLGSNGSVIPTFKRQIAHGGPVTVTHPDITRYFMTIPEASRLVLQAGAIAKGGEIFILDMGEPIKIMDLAKQLIKLSGYEPEVEIKIQITGLRPGEKLYEELLLAEEGTTASSYKEIYKAKPTLFNSTNLLNQIEKFDSTNTKEWISQFVTIHEQVY